METVTVSVATDIEVIPDGDKVHILHSCEEADSGETLCGLILDKPVRAVRDGDHLCKGCVDSGGTLY